MLSLFLFVYALPYLEELPSDSYMEKNILTLAMCSIY